MNRHGWRCKPYGQDIHRFLAAVQRDVQEERPYGGNQADSEEIGWRGRCSCLFWPERARSPYTRSGRRGGDGRIQALEANMAALRAETAALGAVKTEADAIIVAHNHPSGDPTPSKADLQLAKALQSAAQLLGVKFLDRLILGSPDCEEGRGYVSVMEWIKHQ